jgi:diguanylate cyclase (GGDEF)-like protein
LAPLNSYSDSKKLSISKQKSSILRRFLNSIFSVLGVVALLGLPLSLSRIPHTGLLFVHIVHTVIGITILTTLYFRKHLNERVKLVFCVAIFSLLSLTAFLQYGLASPGFYFALTTVFIVSVAVDIKKGVLLTGFFALCISMIGYLWNNGYLIFPGDANEYLLLPSVWLTVGCVFFITSGVFLLSATSYLNEFEKLVDTIDIQKREIEHLANHDPLTDLPTLRLGLDRLDKAVSHARRAKEKVALLFLDLDGFKQINDTAGHDAGDIVLKTIAMRLLKVIRKSDSACRIGGDEFIVMLTNVNDIDTVKEKCSDLVKSISTIIPYGNEELRVGVSIGVAIYPDHATDPSELRKKADKIMYEVKKSGKNNYKLAEA